MTAALSICSTWASLASPIPAMRRDPGTVNRISGYAGLAQREILPMAGDWIKWDKGLSRKPKIIALARELKCSRREAAALCMEFWEWVDDITEDGNVSSVTLGDIDVTLGVSGFAAALIEVAWIIQRPMGFYVVDFERHNGKSAKTRALTKQRVQAHRNAPSVTKALPEKRREKKSKNPPSSPPIAHTQSAQLDIYQAYPRHVGKRRALDSITKAIQRIAKAGVGNPATWLLKRTETYAVSRKDQEARFTPYPAAWFNQGRYDDDLEEWQDGKASSVRGPGELSDAANINQRNQQRAAEAKVEHTRVEERNRLRDIPEAELTVLLPRAQQWMHCDSIPKNWRTLPSWISAVLIVRKEGV